MSQEREVVAAEGTTLNGDTWTLSYRPEGEGGRHYIALLLNGIVNDEGSGFDVPETTEIGFIAGLAPRTGQFFLFGIVVSRIHIVRAESHQERDGSEVETAALAGVTTDDGSALHTFVLVRPPFDNVTALVGLDREGHVVQRIPLPGRLRQS